MTDKRTNRTRTMGKMILLGIGVGALYWVLEPLVHVFVYHHGNLIQLIFNPTLHEMLERLILIGLLIMFSTYTQFAILKRKRMEEEQMAALKRAAEIIEGMFDGVIEVNLDGEIININPALTSMLGYEPKELVGKNVAELPTYAKPEEIEKAIVLMKETIEKGGAPPVPIEMTSKAKDGREFPCSFTVSLIRDVKGNPRSLVAVIRDITERKRAEEALQKSEERYRVLFERSSDAIFLVDAHTGHYLDVNAAAERLTGRSISELKMLTTHDVTPVGAVERLRKVTGIQDSLDFGEVAYVRPDGNTRTALLTAVPLSEDIVFGVAHDITERKRLEYDLGERVKELQCLYGIARVAERPGITLDELLQEVVNLMPASWQYPEITCARITINGKKFETENCRDTEWKQSSDIKVYGAKAGRVEVSYLEERPEIDEGPFLKEERLLIDAVAKQLGRITERMRAEEALRESEERLQLMFESVTDGITVTDLNGVIIELNKRAVEIHGFGSKDEAVGRHSWEFIAPRDHEKAVEHTGKTIEQGRPTAVEYTLVKADGSEFPGEISASVLKDAFGNPIGFIGITRDITERKRMEEELVAHQQELMEKTRELEAASQLKSEFLAGMSHELRTPLNAVIGFSELMLDGVPGEIKDEQRQCLNDILSSGQHVLNLVNDVLDLSKVEAGKMELKPENLNLADVIDDVAQTMRPLLDDNRHKLGVSVEEGLPLVRADKNRLRQIFLNLLSNAIKFTPAGGQLNIEVSREGDWCQVSVIDNGIGIRKEDQERIFEPFCQLDNPLTKEKSGTGLGLTLVNQIIEKHGGRIWVESEYGKGSRFTFTLPLATAD